MENTFKHSYASVSKAIEKLAQRFSMKNASTPTQRQWAQNVIVDRIGPVFETKPNAEGKTYMQRIINFRALKADLVKELQPLLKEGIEAQNAGDYDLAHAKYNEYLNQVSLSCTVFQDSKLDKMIEAGELTAESEVDAVIIAVDSKYTNSGKTIDLDPKTFVVKAKNFTDATEASVEVDDFFAQMDSLIN
jgi:hypothetical protein